MSTYHTPVLLKEAINYLNVQPEKWYIDATIGGGGHTEAILKKGGKVIGLDTDPNSIEEVARKFSLKLEEKEGKLFARSEKLILYQSNFSSINEAVEFICHLEQSERSQNEKSEISQEVRNDKKIYGILFDLGVSSYQLDNPEKGFSFNKDAPLDMRMDPNLEVTAADLVNGLYEKELAELISKFGEDNYSKKIAKAIVTERKKSPIKTTNQLADLISLTIHSREKIHPATRTFQALRIVVNNELENLEKALPQALNLLEPGGRIIVISFHSLEDRIVKNFFRDQEKLEKLIILTNKPITPTNNEVSQNPRSRSAKLRAAEKISISQ